MQSSQKAKQMPFSEQDESVIIDFYKKGFTSKEIGRALNRGHRSIEAKIFRMKEAGAFSANDRKTLPVSPFPILGEDDVLTSEGDALVIPDLEVPFHHAEFVNKIIDLAHSWKINTLHMAGDMMHYDTLSKWGAKWTSKDETKAAQLQDFIMSLDASKREIGFSLLEKMEMIAAPSYQSEMKAAREAIQAIDGFDNILCALGNHDDRFIKSIDKTVGAEELLFQMGVNKDKRWKISQYYYTKLKTEKGEFRLTHQRGAGANVAQDLCAQFHTHVLCAHSHRWSLAKDRSGKLWAGLMGHSVDERRLAYVQVRDARRDSHALGACIIKDGVPHMLHEHTDFEGMKRMYQ